MNYYGYHRTSTTDQHLDRGITEIEQYCKNNNIILRKIYTDQQTGKNFNRERYIVMKEDVLLPGDVLIISELDRLGRNKVETLKELQYYRDHDIRVMILEIPTTLVDYSKMDNSMSRMILETINNMLIEVYAVMAQSEMEKREKRQREGIAAKRLRADWSDYGRPRKLDFETFQKNYKLVEEGAMKPFQLMKKLDLKETTYYRYRAEYMKKKKEK